MREHSQHVCGIGFCALNKSLTFAGDHVEIK
uniref:Uncharacterized protein n=1 Tax=Anguilla anguilla TaxID=7936 RepID=A0A0E9PFD6_ANGAN